MAFFSFILLNPSTPLPLLTFYRGLLQVPPQMLGLTLAGIALGLLLLRRLDHRPAPPLFRAGAVLTAGLALTCLTGLVPLFWPLATATGSVLLLLLDETVHLLASTFGLLGYATSQLVRDSRRLLASAKARKSPVPQTLRDAR